MSQTNDSTNSTTPPGETEVKARRRTNSLASLLRKGANMAAGITAHQEVLSPNGLNEEIVQSLNQLVRDCNDLDDQQEILKGQLKEKTATLTENSKQLKDLLSKYTHIVKAVVTQKRWVDFGISARR